MKENTRYEGRIINAIQASITVKQSLLSDGVLVSSIARISKVCLRALRDGGKIFLFGNGGSAADAQHIAAEFLGRFAFNRPALPALALPMTLSSATAIGNDCGFEQIFSRQLEALAQEGDVAMGFSTSGNSANVLLGLSTAKKMHLHCIGLTGSPGGKLKQAPGLDHCICVPSRDTPRVQECHLLIGHIISELVEQELFGSEACVSRSR